MTPICRLMIWTKPKMYDLWHVGRSLASTRMRTRSGLSRTAFEAWQARKVQRWLQRDVPKVRQYASGAAELRDLPIMNKATMMADFGAFNLMNVSADQGWRCFEDGGTFGKISVGASTGTSGNRALYMITPQERLRWLGVILAKALPRFPLQPERVAVILPQSSALYDTAARARQLKLAFFDLTDGMETWSQRLEKFDPTCVVGPPRVLRALAEANLKLRPRILYSGAETLDPVDRDIIEAAFCVPLGQIYMATEGLFAVSCPHGALHLAEDAVFFEFEPAENGLVNPIVSCFQRRFQIMARYRMNDLLRLADTPCSCGSPLRVVDEVVGRMDDLFVFSREGQPICFTPDVLRSTVLDTDRQIDDFRIRRIAENQVELVLPNASHQNQIEKSRHALETLMRIRCPDVSVSARTEDLQPDGNRKLRRVENRWRSTG